MATREKTGKQPWDDGDPTKKIGINVPMPEPLMKQLTWLVENRAIRSKSSFIRDVVASAAAELTARTLKVQKVMREIDEKSERTRA